MFFLTELYGERPSPCGQWRLGDTDLNTFDIIREYQLDQYEETRYEGVTRVPGSNELQTAYRLEERSNLTIRSIEAFPAGIIIYIFNTGISIKLCIKGKSSA